MRSRAPVLAAVTAVAVVQALTSRTTVPAGAAVVPAPVALSRPVVTLPRVPSADRVRRRRLTAALVGAVSAPVLALALPAALPSPASVDAVASDAPNVHSAVSAAGPAAQQSAAAGLLPEDAAAVEAARQRVLAERAELAAAQAARATRSAEGRAAASGVTAPAAGTPAAVPAPPVPAAAVEPSTVAPVAAPVGSRYGPRWGRLHAGLDFPAPYGTPIRAVADGLVEQAGPAGGYGTLVTVRHADGTVTAYGHARVLTVTPGQLVEAGQVIAEVGSEGRSTGPHLHFEVRTPGGTVDPEHWLTARGVAL